MWARWLHGIAASCGDMEREWARLGRALAEAREAAGLTQVEAASAIGVSRGPIQAIERGHTAGVPFKKVTGTMRSYARLVGWADGSIENVLDGGDPTPADAQPAAASPEPTAVAPVSDLPLRIIHALGEGALLDSEVLDLAPEGSDATMVIITRTAPNASPDQIRRDLLALKAAYRRLRGEPDAETDHPTVNKT